MKKGILLLSLILIFTSVFAQAKVTIAQAQDDYTLEQGKALIAKINESGGKNKNLLLGIVYHNLTRYNGKTYTDLSIKHCKFAYKESRSPLALGYQGSAITIQGSVWEKKGNVLKASECVESGWKLIDQAVNLSPKLVDLRILRINNAIDVSISSPFKRFDVVKKDIAFVMKQINRLTTVQKSSLYLLKGRYHYGVNEIDKAIVSLEKAIKFAPNSISAKLAQKYLNELEE